MNGPPLVLFSLAWLASCGPGAGPDAGAAREPDVPAPFTRAEVQRVLRHSPVGAPRPDTTNRYADDERAAHFGQFLFFDTRLSKSGETACSTCHDPAQSFIDGRMFAEGTLRLDRNTPSLWNMGQNRWFFWDGRADSLWAQALQPLENPLEHAGSRLAYAHLVQDDADLRAAYEGVFGPMPDLADSERFPPEGRPVPITPAERAAREAGLAPWTAGMEPGDHPHQRAWDSMTAADQDAVTQVFVNLGKAIAAYQRRLISDDSDFDRFVRGLREGDAELQGALDDSARRGLALFVGKARCFLCHSGPSFTDFEFHNTAVAGSAEVEAIDVGRQRGIGQVLRDPFNGKSRWSDDPDGDARVKLDYFPQHLHAFREFKTPSLRNVASTAPYMHQGQLATLADVVHFYSTFEGAEADPLFTDKTLIALNLSAEEQADLVRFLESLTDGDLDPKLTRKPASPLGMQ